MVGGGTFELGGNFVVAVVVMKAEVGEFQLIVEYFMRLVWDCLNGRTLYELYKLFELFKLFKLFKSYELFKKFKIT